MKVLASKGNKKIGKDTLIINITSATDCPSKKKGLCKHCGKCYAMKAERIYPQVLPYRRKQTKIFDQLKVFEYSQDLREIIGKRRIKTKYIRFSESGDFRNQKDVDKLFAIAKSLKDLNIVIYGYTARKDLNFDHRPANLVMNGSSFMIDNNFTPYEKGKACKMNCRICNLCKTKGNKTINVKMH